MVSVAESRVSSYCTVSRVGSYRTGVTSRVKGPHENFDSDPEVHHGPYEYSVPGTEGDFIMQDAPPSATQGSQGWMG